LDASPQIKQSAYNLSTKLGFKNKALAIAAFCPDIKEGYEEDRELFTGEIYPGTFSDGRETTGNLKDSKEIAIHKTFPKKTGLLRERYSQLVNRKPKEYRGREGREVKKSCL